MLQKFFNNALALWHYLEFLPGVYPVTDALTLSIYYYIKTLHRFIEKYTFNLAELFFVNRKIIQKYATGK